MTEPRLSYEEYRLLREAEVRYIRKGGPGSGYFDHPGRPGKVGGSLPADAERVTTHRRPKPTDPKDPSDYLVVVDPEVRSTWRLPVKRDGQPNPYLMRAAWQALMSPRGYRGHRYRGPQREEAIKKLKALFAEAKMPLPTIED